MRERSRDKNRLEHMLQAIERICRYTKGKNFEDFIADDMMYLLRSSQEHRNSWRSIEYAN